MKNSYGCLIFASDSPSGSLDSVCLLGSPKLLISCCVPTHISPLPAGQMNLLSPRLLSKEVPMFYLNLVESRRPQVETSVLLVHALPGNDTF